MTTVQMPQGVPTGTTCLTTSARDCTKDPSGYNVSGAEGVGENNTTTYPRTEATIDLGYVPYAD